MLVVSSRSAVAAIATNRGGVSRGKDRLLATVTVMGVLPGTDTAHHLGDKVVIGGMIPMLPAAIREQARVRQQR